MISIKHSWFFVIVLLVVSARPGMAETITINSGGLGGTPFAAAFHLVGDERGLIFDGQIDPSRRLGTYPECSFCPTGTLVDPVVSQLRVVGTVTLDGLTHQVGLDFNGPVAGVRFGGPPIPAGSDRTVPFLFTGYFRENPSSPTVDFVGSGVVSLFFAPSTLFPGSCAPIPKSWN